jgi:flagellar M-ring protein FliF
VNGKWIEFPRKRQPEELKLIEDLAQAAIGFNSARGDVISVQNLSFERGPAEEDQPVTLVDQARKSLNDYSSAVRYGAIFFLFLLVYLLAIRPLQKRALAVPEKPVVAPATIASLRTEPEFAVPETPASLAQRSQTLKKQLAEFVKAEPESSTTVVRAWLREEATS